MARGLISVIRPDDPPIYPPLVGKERRRAFRDLWFADHGVFRTFFNTRARVSPRLWRSAQPLPYQINGAARLGIKTIINLRGPSDSAFYRLEEEYCRRNAITLVNFEMTSRRPPSRDVVLAADELFRTIEYPALIHCKSGVDRSGLMAALFLILHEGQAVAKARRQLSVRFGHIKQGKTGILDHFLAAYQAYDKVKPTPFLTWVRTVYDPEALRAGFKPKRWADALLDVVLRRE